MDVYQMWNSLFDRSQPDLKKSFILIMPIICFIKWTLIFKEKKDFYVISIQEKNATPKKLIKFAMGLNV